MQADSVEKEGNTTAAQESARSTLMKRKALDLILTSTFASLTAVGASIQVPLPFTPIPITLQTFFVYASGTLLGGHLGALSQSLYILVGMLGLPVFAGWRSGFGVLIGPTGGYLLGFIPGSYVIGKLAETKTRPSIYWLLFSIAAGTSIIYLIGILQTAAVLGITLSEAMATGVFPFILGDSAKAVVAALVANRIGSLFPFKQRA